MRLVDVRPISISGNIQEFLSWEALGIYGKYTFIVDRFPGFNVFLNPNKVYTLENLSCQIGKMNSLVNGESYETNGDVSPILMIGMTNLLKPSELFENYFSGKATISENTILDDFLIADKSEFKPTLGEDQLLKFIPTIEYFPWFTIFPKLYDEPIAVLPIITEYIKNRYNGGGAVDTIRQIAYSSAKLEKVYIKSQNYKYLQFVFGIQTAKNLDSINMGFGFSFSINANLTEYIP